MQITPLEILQKYWKHDSFRPLQEEIITSVLENQDTFALLPTGGGKSLCFQIPAIIKPGICIVISPLIALMQDQVHLLQNKGFKAMALTSGIKYDELDTLLDNCIYGNYKFLYLSPERLQQDIVKERIQRMQVNLIAVDEAHCISQWGNDFRPSYKKILTLRELKPSVPIIALTASATPTVREDITKSLDLFQPNVFKGSFFRKNLGYWILSNVTDKYDKMLQILKTYNGSSIIYVRNRKMTLEINDFLTSQNISSTYYHGGVDKDQKTLRFQQWVTEKKRVMVATNAFGMGIDKPNVRSVIHFSIPESIESYFQEAGRAGRDGKKAYAFLLQNNQDIKSLHNQFIKVLPDTNFVKTVYRKLCNYFQLSYGEGEQITKGFNFNTFCKTYELHTMMTYYSLQFLDRCSVITFEKKHTKKSNICILVSSNHVLDFIKSNPTHELITKAILRTYGGIFDEETPINLSQISAKIGVSKDEIISTLGALQEAGILLFNYQKTDAEVTFLQPREDDRTINRISQHLKAQYNSKVEKIQAITKFIESQDQCRSQLLLSYFGENKSTECGICDHCNHPNNEKYDIKQVSISIVDLLKNDKLSSRNIIAKLEYPENTILLALKKLIEKQIIEIHQNNTYGIKHV